MSILVKSMKIPRNCWQCQINVACTIHGAHCPYAERIVPRDEFNMHIGRHPDCPLVEVPEPHGRLVDADVIDSRVSVREDGFKGETHDVLTQVRGLIATTPTVIEAEDEDD